MPKIYLSPAAHGADNPCSHDKQCGENIHCNLYMDELEPYLKACGMEYKRSNKENKGNRFHNTIAESNDYQPDLHYAAHTNAAAPSAAGSRPYVYPTGNGRKYAEILAKHRRKIYPYPVRIFTNNTWAEMIQTKAVVVYDELVFHTNKEDIAWFHQNMRKMAEHTCRAFCEIFGVAFVDPYAVPKPAPIPSTDIKVGDVVTYQGRLYGDSYGGNPGATVSGTYEVTRVIPGRKYGIHLGKSGWAEAELVKPVKAAPAPAPALKVGDKVKIIGTPTYYNSKNKVPLFIRILPLYVRQIDGDRVLISWLKKGAVTGWVSVKNIKKV